ncbi:hypothetical protein [Microvirga sp. G4-2]|uniref:hypothetical protein n=1 Tax=Microvirga sp. G4-2 TaxID=3434467 RepID=UPI004043E892
METDVYWCIPRKRWSIRQRGRVINHVTMVTLSRCTMHVRETERLRCLERRQRSVHAWIRGEIQDVTVDHAADLIQIGYSPWCVSHFTTRPDFRPIYSARLVVFHSEGRAWALP